MRRQASGRDALEGHNRHGRSARPHHERAPRAGHRRRREPHRACERGGNRRQRVGGRRRRQRSGSGGARRVEREHTALADTETQRQLPHARAVHHPRRRLPATAGRAARGRLPPTRRPVRARTPIAPPPTRRRAPHALDRPRARPARAALPLRPRGAPWRGYRARRERRGAAVIPIRSDQGPPASVAVTTTRTTSAATPPIAVARRERQRSHVKAGWRCPATRASRGARRRPRTRAGRAPCPRARGLRGSLRSTVATTFRCPRAGSRRASRSAPRPPPTRRGGRGSRRFERGDGRGEVHPGRLGEAERDAALESATVARTAGGAGTSGRTMRMAARKQVVSSSIDG